MTKPNSTEIVVLLDRSGSMNSIAADMRGAFDAFIAEQRKDPSECRVSLFQFNNEFSQVYMGVPLASVEPLKINPSGGTALVDALCKAIDLTGSRLRDMADHERPARLIFIVISDGEENSSVKYRRAQAMERVTHQREKYGWQFLFFGAGQDAIAEAQSYGIPQALNFQANAAGVMRSVGLISKNVAEYRTSGSVLPNLGADK